MASWNFWNTPKTFKTTIEVPEPTADSVLTLPSGSQRLAGINDLQPNYRNRIINGAMNVNQINGTTAVTPVANGAYFTDMFNVALTQASKLTFQQVVDAPAGFKYSTKVTVASQYAPLSTDYFMFQQRIEGQNITDFAFGTAGAVTLNTSNWIKGSVAGTYSVAIYNGTGRSYIGTINVTTSWTKVSITLVGDTAGTWVTDNTIGMFWTLDLGSGSNFNTTAGAWQVGNFLRTAGSVTFVNQVAGSTLNITGVQLEKVPTGATQGTDYEWLSYDEEERRCARYLPVWSGITVGTAGTTSNGTIPIVFKVPARVTPTGVLIPTGLTLAAYGLTSQSASTAITSIALYTGLGTQSPYNQAISVTVTGTPFTQNTQLGLPVIFYSGSNKLLFTGAQL